MACINTSFDGLTFLTSASVQKYLSFVRKGIMTCVLSCLYLSAFAQFQIPFLNYTTDNGLVQNQISGICQDTKGYMWFATAEGISRFDGKNFKNYTVEDGLPARTATAILADRQDRIWVATQGGGLAMYNGRGFKAYGIQDGLVSNNISASDPNPLLIEDSQGNIWCRSSEGVSVIRRDGIRTYQIGMVTCFAEDKRGRMICATRGKTDVGISVIDKEEVAHYTVGSEFGTVIGIAVNNNGEVWIAGANSRIARFSDGALIEPHTGKGQFAASFFDSSGNLWLATIQDGLFVFSGNDIVSFGEVTGLVTRVFEDTRGNIWFLTPDDGVYRYDGHNLAHYQEQCGLIGNQAKRIFEDFEGHIWIGTDNGISMYGKVIFEILTTASGLPTNHIISVLADKDGNVWFSPQNSGLVKFDGQHMDFYEYQYKERSPRANFIISMAAARDRILLGALSGIGEFRDGKISFSNNHVKDMDVNHILVIGDEYWLASSYGLVHMRGEKVDVYHSGDGLADDAVNFLACDHMSRIWCTTALGVSVFDGKQFTTYTTENGLPNNSCTDIAIDIYGNIWVGTDDGLCRISETPHGLDFKTYTTKDGLASNSISLVHADQSDILWVGYVNGLNTIDLKSGAIHYYGKEDGYLPMDCYQGAAATDVYGHVWFGTVAGLVKYLPEADVRSPDPPRTYITRIELLGGEDIRQYADSIDVKTGLPVNLSLPHDKNTIRLDWIGIHFTVPAKNRYRYILENYEKVWHEASIETYREYQLSPGHYTFKVMACNNDGVWNIEPVTYSFTVRPPWWATIVAYVAYALVLLILIYLYIRWRERSLIEKNRILEEKVYERTLEIELQKQNILEINKSLQEYQEELITQRDLAAEQRDQIDEQRTEILSSIHYAKRIQTAIMPKPEQLKAIIPNYFLFFRPRDVVSGDYYWAAQKGSKSVIVVADCTGHGVPGAFMSMLGISVLNEIVMKQNIDTASKILDELRFYLKMLLSQTGAVGEQHDGMDVALCIIDYQAMELQYAGAYNSLYLIRKNELIEYKADKMPVGIHFGDEKPFTNHLICLEHGDMLYIFSDGYVDQFGGTGGSKFKTKPFKQLLTDMSMLSVEQQETALIEAHETWKGNNYQVDDILVLGVRID